MRAALAGCAAVVIGCLTAVAGTAHAQEYRYWSYWQADGDGWAYANTGPATHRPKDGAVDGWRFGVAPDQEAAKPRTEPDFDRVCAGIRIKDGYKRIGLVVDYGTAADAPDGGEPPRKDPATRCVVVPVSATSADVLEEENRTRIGSDGLLCAVDGYPADGCGEAADPTGSSAAASPEGTAGAGDGDNTSTYLAIGAGVVIAALLVAAMTARRRRERRGS